MLTPQVLIPCPVTPLRTSLTITQFHTPEGIPPELEWFANLTNAYARRAYRQDIHDFMTLAGLQQPERFRDATRAHVIARRQQLTRQGLANDIIRRKLVALYLFVRAPYGPA